MTAPLTVIIAGYPALVDALQESGRIRQVLGVDSTSQLQQLTSQMPAVPHSELVFAFADTLTVDTDQGLAELIGFLVTNRIKVVLLGTGQVADQLAGHFGDGVGLLRGPFTANLMLGALSGLPGVAMIPAAESGYRQLPPPGMPSTTQTAAPAAQPAAPVAEPQAAWAQPADQPPAAQPPAAPQAAWAQPAEAATAAPQPDAPAWTAPAQPDTPAPQAAPAAPAWTQPGEAPTAQADAPAPQGDAPAASQPPAWTQPAQPVEAAPAAPAWTQPTQADQAPAPAAQAPAAQAAPSQPVQPVQPAPAGDVPPWAQPADAATAAPWPADPTPAAAPAWAVPGSPSSLPGDLAPAAGHGSRRGKMIAIVAPKGGVGKSFFSTNIAAFAALKLQQSGRKVALIDGNYQQADVGKLLNLYSPSLSDVARHDGPLTPTLLEERYLASPATIPMKVLLGPATAAEANPMWINSSLYNRVWEPLSELADYVFVDTPVAEVYHDIFDNFVLPNASFLIVLAAPHKATLINVEEYLRTITGPSHDGGRDFPQERLGIVLNRAEEGVALDTDVIRHELGRWRWLGHIPESPEIRRAANQNELIAHRGFNDIVSGFSSILHQVTGDDDFAVPAGGLPDSDSKPSWLRRLFGK